MWNGLPDLFLILLALLALGQICLALYLWKSEKEFLAELARAFGLPAQQRKNWHLWHRALRQAQGVLGTAELEGVKMVADTKYQTRQLGSVYEDQLRLATTQMEEQFAKISEAAQQEYGKYLAELLEQSEKAQREKTEEFDKLVGGGMEAFTKRLEEKLTMVEDRVLRFSQEETMRVKLEAEAYRKKMADMTGEEVTAVVERVAKVVLGKKLPLEVQVGLVNEALEQAKKEKFIT